MSSTPSSAPPPETVWDQLGGRVRETVLVEGRSFDIVRPAESQRLLDHPAVHAAFESDEYMPYWADLWPAARMLAQALVKETPRPQTRVLEIGCGLGLPGIVALSLGMNVTFSDYDACALRFAAENARLNGFNDYQTLQLDWRYPPSDLRFPLLLAADLIYELRNIEPLVRFIKQVLTDDGECRLTDEDRIPAQALRDTLSRESLTYTTQIARAAEPGGIRLKGTLYKVRRRPLT